MYLFQMRSFFLFLVFSAHIDLRVLPPVLVVLPVTLPTFSGRPQILTLTTSVLHSPVVLQPGIVTYEMVLGTLNLLPFHRDHFSD
jgi:hypothetical protein